MKKMYQNFLFVGLLGLISLLSVVYGVDGNTGGGTSSGCGIASGVATSVFPSTGLCAEGYYLTNTGQENGLFFWKCYKQGLFSICSAPIRTQESNPSGSLGNGTENPIAGKTVEECRNDSNTILYNPVGGFNDGVAFPIPSCFSLLGYGTRSNFFDILLKTDYGVPRKFAFPVKNSLGQSKDLYINQLQVDKNFYIPYNTGINCDTYWEDKVAVKDRGYFGVYCQGCGQFNGQDTAGYAFNSGKNLYAYSSEDSINCNSIRKEFQCNGDNRIASGVIASDYPYLTCNNSCTDWRSGLVGNIIFHGVVVTGYINSSSLDCLGESKMFVCNNGTWSDFSSTTSYIYPTCTGDVSYSGYTCVFQGTSPTGSGRLMWNPTGLTGKPLSSSGSNYIIGNSIYAINASQYACYADAQCNPSTNGVSTTTYPSSDSLCSRASAIINDDTVGNGGDYNWTCKGLGGLGSDATCSAPKVAIIDGTCGNASGSSSVLRFSTLPLDSQLCSSSASITKPTRSSVSYHSNYTWTCNGTGGGTSMTCSLEKVYPYYQYQCQLSGTTALRWSLINYPTNGSGFASSKATTYISGNAIYASPTAGNTNYFADYSCKANAQCGSSHDTNSYTKPTSGFCALGTYVDHGDYGDYWYWNCDGLNGGSNVDCRTYKSQTATCGTADGNTYIDEPSDSQLCGTYSSISRYYDSSYNSVENRSTFSNNATVRWYCNGVHGGDSSSWCSATRKHYTYYECKFQNSELQRDPNASITNANASTIGSYDLGAYVYASAAAGNTYYIGNYTCECPDGQTFDSNLGCVVPVQSLNAVCGSANGNSYSSFPTSNKCSTYSSITDNDIYGTDGKYNWTCNGVNGGENKSCEATRLMPVDGSCGTTAYNCTTGTSVSNVFSSNKYTWTCNGINEGNNVSCSKCATNYHTEDSGTTCISNSRRVACSGTFPASHAVANNTGYYIQTWSGSTWSTGLSWTKNETTVAACNFKCDSGWTGATCQTAIKYTAYKCTYQSAPTWQDYTPMSGAKSSVGTYKNDEFIYTDTLVGYTCDPKIAGKCGTEHGTTGYNFPTSNLCASGQLASQATGTTGFTWNCNGIYGSTTGASCSAGRKRDGVCGNANNKSYTNPGGTTQSVKDYFAGQGLCTYSTNNPTASNVSLTSPNATWSCNGLNGGNTVSCTGTYDISISYCATGTNIASNSAGVYTKVVGPAVGTTGWATPVNSTSGTVSADNKIATTVCSGYFSCAGAGLPPTLVSSSESCSTTYKCATGYIVSGTVSQTVPTAGQTCAKICDDSDVNKGTCGAGWTIYYGASSATRKPDYTLDCRAPGGAPGQVTCNMTCPSGKYRAGTNGGGCISTATTCNNASSTCNNGIRTGYDSSNSCGPTWSCYNGDYSSPISTATGCQKRGTASQYWNGTSFATISCVGPAGSYNYGNTQDYTMSIGDGKSKTCTYSCGGDCNGGVSSEVSCTESCSDGYQADGSYCCPKKCTGGDSTIKINYNGEKEPWAPNTNTMKVGINAKSYYNCYYDDTSSWATRIWLVYQCIEGDGDGKFPSPGGPRGLQPVFIPSRKANGLTFLHYIIPNVNANIEGGSNSNCQWCPLRSAYTQCEKDYDYSTCPTSNSCSITATCPCPNGGTVVNGKCQWKGTVYRYLLEGGWGIDDPACNQHPYYNSNGPTGDGFTFMYEASYWVSPDSCYIDRLIGKSWRQRNYKKFYRTMTLSVGSACRKPASVTDFGKSNLDDIAIWPWESDYRNSPDGTIDGNGNCN